MTGYTKIGLAVLAVVVLVIGGVVGARALTAPSPLPEVGDAVTVAPTTPSGATTPTPGATPTPAATPSPTDEADDDGDDADDDADDDFEKSGSEPRDLDDDDDDRDEPDDD